MDQNNNHVMNRVANFVASLTTLGYDDNFISAMACTARYLIDNATKLSRYKNEPPPDNAVDLLVAQSSVDILLHSSLLLPYWKEMINGLSSIVHRENNPSIEVILRRVQLSQDVTTMLLKSLKTTQISKLILSKNNLGKHGFEFVADVLDTSTSLTRLYIDSNPIESKDVAATFANALIKHSSLKTLLLENCGIGQNDGIMDILVSALFRLVHVSLDSNSIGSYGVKLLSDNLASNPELRALHLNGNLLNDSDAKMLAGCLKTNTNLRALRIAGNRITGSGMVALHQSVNNVFGLNELYDSNHTCSLDFGDKGPEDTWLRQCHFDVINTTTDPVHNKNRKFLGRLHVGGGKYLKEDTPIEIIPMVLALLRSTTKKERKLNVLFGFVSEWNMPLLYTSCAGPQLRRSKRIHKKMVMKYMVK